MRQVRHAHLILRLTRHDGLRFSARMGYAVSGSLHLIVAYLIVRIALGARGTHADPSGALETVAETRGGVVALWIVVVALVPLMLWRLAEALVGLHPAEGHQPHLNDDHRPGNRLKALGLMFIYCGIGYTALRYALGSGSESREETAGITARMMQNGWGRMALILGGAAVAGIGAYFAFKGASRRFRTDLTDPVGPIITGLGFFGYFAEGLVLSIAGLMAIVAVVEVDPSKATGIDAAVKAVGATQPGLILLIFAAAGFASYGLYSLTLTRFARM
ncbi:DUF1206 domain-containing protein [Mycolicibacterium sp. F2034L]|uniref:DUF1206 domain-containing protein n=1 Tax=Mycolicibacterium sp. F2034L TaxID=2926422 RepID=UPI001FF4397A|nr:DUF1206 domain-containing protein [Mycolicibacterium sp. F2034L]MCK0176682.1 DUF1206 domain-containing protein [Mycolicibacterium sp. F2034L]